MQNDPNPLNERNDSTMDKENILPVLPLFGFDNSDEVEQDLNYIKRLYPKEVVEIQSEIERECDRLEYDGSPMYHAYPDKSYLESVSNTIYERFTRPKEEPNVSAANLGHDGFRGGRCHGVHCPPRPPFGHCRGRRCDFEDHNPWLRNTINVLLLNEMLNRRRRYRSYKRIF